MTKYRAWFMFTVIQTEGKLSAMDKEIKLCVQRESTVSVPSSTNSLTHKGGNQGAHVFYWNWA